MMAVLDAYERAYFLERNLEATLGLLDGDLSGFGTGLDERVFGSGAARALYARDLSAVPEPIAILRRSVSLERLGPRSFLAATEFDLMADSPEGKIVLENLRASYLFMKRPSGWKLRHLHISAPLREQAPEEPYPMEALRRRNQELELLVAQRTADLELLLREVHHRIKNNMTTIASVLSLHAQDLGGRCALSLTDAANRVRSMMALYDQLYRRESYRAMEFRDYLELLMVGLRETLCVGRPIRILTDVQGADVPVNTAFYLGIIANELVTNACKYAFPDGKGGTIRVRFTGPDPWVLEVADDGVPLDPRWVEGTGFGHVLLSAVAAQLKADLRVRELEGGGKAFRVARERG